MAYHCNRVFLRGKRRPPSRKPQVYRPGRSRNVEDVSMLVIVRCPACRFPLAPRISAKGVGYSCPCTERRAALAANCLKMQAQRAYRLPEAVSA